MPRMILLNQMKINFFKKEKNWKKEKQSLWLNVNFYWKLAVGFIFITIISSFFFGYYLFQKVNKEFVLEAGGDSSQVKIVKKERILKVLEYFSLRKQKSAEILKFPAPVIDPSL